MYEGLIVVFGKFGDRTFLIIEGDIMFNRITLGSRSSSNWVCASVTEPVFSGSCSGGFVHMISRTENEYGSCSDGYGIYSDGPYTYSHVSVWSLVYQKLIGY